MRRRGHPAGDFVWDTRGLESDFYKVWQTPGQPGGGRDGFTAAFINGPDWGQAPISLPLENGPNRFTLFFEFNGPWPRFAINLFFDGNRVPGISAKVSLRTTHQVPRFTINTAALTYSMTSYPYPDVLAAGTTGVLLDKFVNLQAFSVVAPDNIDRVDTHAVGASGRSDYIGSFTLNVSARK